MNKSIHNFIKETLAQKIQQDRPMLENHHTCFILKLPVKSPKTLRENTLWCGLSEFSLYNRENIFVMPYPGMDVVPNVLIEGYDYLDELLEKVQYQYGDIVIVDKIC